MIRENHVNQLFGTVTSYIIENNCNPDSVVGILITNTHLSDVAKKFADRLKIKYQEKRLEEEKKKYLYLKIN